MRNENDKPVRPTNDKLNALSANRVTHTEGKLTTNQGVGVVDTDNAQKAGERGPTLMQDFIFREKLTHFDHERIPERVVHARGSGAHGHFRVYQSQSARTSAHFLGEKDRVTPVFVRFSTVAGFRGSPDTVRDVRGFAVKFYTQEGNYDLVGNNFPVFFVQDAMKFPDLIHSVKPEPNTEMPQAASAHDTFWDFVTATPETAHTVMWLMSDRALPRSYRTMEGFGIHTFRWINAKNEVTFVKYIWKPILGVHSMLWDETQRVAGKDPDFNRRDLYNAIETGAYPEWELCVQFLRPEDEHKFDFDILDCSKLWPEELIPIQRIGKMTLTNNPVNFFAETEQIAFCPANLVPGIDLSEDPMLQGRLFSYLDTQLLRLGGPNFHQIPINQPLNKVNNNQRDGMHRMTLDEGQTAYFPTALNHGQPHPAAADESAYRAFAVPTVGNLTHARGKKFADFYSQAALFYNSLAPYERDHVLQAFCFELGKVKNKDIRQAAVNMFNNVDGDLARNMAAGLGAAPPDKPGKKFRGTPSPALSQANQPSCPCTMKVAVLLESGYDKTATDTVLSALKNAGATFDIISGAQGLATSIKGQPLGAGETYATAASVLYDAVFVPSGKTHVQTLSANGDAVHFVSETFKHLKPVLLLGEAADLLGAAHLPIAPSSDDAHENMGVVLCKKGACIENFIALSIAALTQKRFFARDAAAKTVSA